MSKNNITIDGREYVAADSIATGQKDGQWQIVVLQRGWVVVGQVAELDNEVVLTDASMIRRWGTTRGVGELRNGPTAKTVLDFAGVVRTHPAAIILRIDSTVGADSWKR